MAPPFILHIVRPLLYQLDEVAHGIHLTGGIQGLQGLVAGPCVVAHLPKTAVPGQSGSSRDSLSCIHPQTAASTILWPSGSHGLEASVGSSFSLTQGSQSGEASRIIVNHPFYAFFKGSYELSIRKGVTGEYPHLHSGGLQHTDQFIVLLL